MFIERPIGTTWDAPHGATPFYILVLKAMPGWIEYLTRKDQECNITVVREFAASLVKVEPPYSFRARVRGNDVNLNLFTIASLIGIPPLVQYYCPFAAGGDIPSADTIATFLTSADGSPREWVGDKMVIGDLLEPYRMLFLAISNSILMTKHRAHIYLHQAQILYAIANKKPVCLVRLLINEIVDPTKAKHLKDSIPCGALITRLCYE